MKKIPILEWPRTRIVTNIGSTAIFSVAGALFWTLAGLLVAALTGQFEIFFREWILIQGFFCSLSALFLGGLATSSILDQKYRELCQGKDLLSDRRYRQYFQVARTAVVLFVATVGTLTTTNLGFNSDGWAKSFLWLTCALICSAAGLVTWHAVEILFVASRLENAQVRLFPISPATSQNLRGLATYFTWFGVAMTIGYVFAFTGTLANDWAGAPWLVRTVQVFWPMIYFPLSCLILLYPYFSIRSLVRAEKSRIISRHEAHIAKLLDVDAPPHNEEIKQINALADLIERVENSPDSPFLIPFAALAGFSTALNGISLLIPRQLAGDILRTYFLSPGQ